MTRMFRSAGRWRHGYETGQVDDFFAEARDAYEGRSEQSITGGDVRRATFDLIRGGYRTVAVDGALDRLERAFVARRRSEFVQTHGQQAWMEHLAGQARTLYPRLARPDGERFAPPRRGEAGYRAEDVDVWCRRLVDYFDRGEPLTSDELRHATFGRAKARTGYAESAVDAFFDRAIDVLLGVE